MRALAGGAVLLWLACGSPTPTGVPEPPGSRTEQAPTGEPAWVGGSGNADPSATLARAVALASSGELQDALRGLDPLLPGPLSVHVRLLRARWLLELGRASEARQELETAIAEARPRDVRARLFRELAQLELARGTEAAARAAQESAWQETTDADLAATLAFELAEVFERRGLRGEALNLYRTVWERWPASLEAPRAFALSSQIERETLADRPEVASLLEHLTALRRVGRCESALEIFPQVMAREDKSAEQERALRQELAGCLFRTRQYPEAAQRYTALARELTGDDAVDAAILAARARARAGQVMEGVNELSEVARRADEPKASFARYLVALLLDERDPRSSRRLMRRVAKQDQDPDLARNARWQLAWAALERGASAQALKHLEPLCEGPIRDIEVQRARYWRAVLREAGESPAAGREELREIAEAIPLSYYGMLAADRLGLSPEPVRPVIDEPRGEIPPIPALDRARWLWRGGLPDLARDELRSWRMEAFLTRSERLAGATLLHELGEHYRATQLITDGFGDSLERGIDPDWRAAWIAAWPRPFGEPVSEAVREFEFDDHLVYAIMREESRYRPQVQSAAGARGLMQLVPPTARRIAASLGMDGFDADRLYEPEVNVRFGTYYLRELTEKFEGFRPYAVAAYNAGPEVVSNWRTREGADQIDRFVDSVPYGETRRYLRRVLRSYRVYRMLYPEAGAEPVAGDASAPDPSGLNSASPLASDVSAPDPSELNSASPPADGPRHAEGSRVSSGPEPRRGRARVHELPS